LSPFFSGWFREEELTAALLSGIPVNRLIKSLLVSTLKSLFEGKRELFKGVAIDSLDFEWKKISGFAF
jgi:hypothetical protein